MFTLGSEFGLWLCEGGGHRISVGQASIRIVFKDFLCTARVRAKD